MSETYFITGANGCIGSWIVKLLVERGDSVVVFDRDTNAGRLHTIIDADGLSDVQFIAGDITDAAAVQSALDKSAAKKVIHLAGLQVPACKANPAQGALVNVVGTLNVFEAVRTSGLSKVVYASSAAVVGLSEDDEPVNESTACEPTTHYGVFKRANEGNAKIYFSDHGLSSVGLRPLTVYGVNRDTGLTSDPTKAMKAAVLNRPFHIRFSGATDFQYVADTAAAFIASADATISGAQVFNLHGETADVAQVVKLINTEAGYDGITFDGLPIPISPEFDDKAIRRIIGDLPTTTLADGVHATIKHFAALRDEGRLDTSDLE